MIMKNWRKKKVENENPKSKFSTLNLLHKLALEQSKNSIQEKDVEIGSF
jgi:hypothetical protein